jgi:DNA-binding transcriptional ArsR family regulator
MVVIKVVYKCGSIVMIWAPEGEASSLMTGKSALEYPPTEIFKALSDPVRWSIIVQMASVDELACITLESTLPVSKPTISYHTKILQNAGLISTRKAGRNYYYSLRRDVLGDLLDSLWELAPAPRSVVGTQNGVVGTQNGVVGTQNGSAQTSRRQKRTDPARVTTISRQRAVDDEIEEAAVLTW